MNFRFDNEVLFHKIFLPLFLVLLGGLSAEAQCSVEQVHKLLGEGGDFGFAVATDGITAIVGARYYNDDAGSAYLFDVTTGQQIAKLVPDDNAEDDLFGRAVSIGGTIAIIGASLDDDNGDGSGSAYLFDVTTGQQIVKLLAEDGQANDRFGFRVGISGSTAIVGARLDDDNGENSGSAYLFDTSTGQQIVKLLPNDGTAGDYFGHSVSVSGTTAIVGAPGDDDNGEDSGSAYLFDTTTGKQIAKLLSDDGAAGDNFGQSIAISSTTAIVGAPYDDEKGIESGSAYLFDMTTGQQIAKLLPDDGAANDVFGWSFIGVSDTTAIVGAYRNDDNGDDSGSAYLFDITTSKQIMKLVPDDNSANDRFGIGVAISGTTAIVGAINDDDNGPDFGAAYLFDVSNCSGSDVVAANQFNVFRGLLVVGVLSDSFESDDSYLKFNPGLTINSAEPPVWIEFEGTLPSDNPISLSTTLEAQASTVGLNQTIEMFNWNTNQYQQVDAQAASWNNDTIVTINVTAAISDYVGAGTGAVKTRVGWKQTGLILNYPWTVCIDQVVWTVQ